MLAPRVRAGIVAGLVLALGTIGCRAERPFPPEPVQWLDVPGLPAFAVGQNAYGRDLEGFRRYLDASAGAGERVVRLQLDYGLGAPQAGAGQVDEAWADRWAKVFREAARRRIHVLPSFGSWASWADPSGESVWNAWAANPYNAANGGPASHPSELLDDSPTQRLFLSWMAALVARWADQDNVLGWEIFSELDLASGGDDRPRVIAFVERAAHRIRAADPRGRPITASVSGAETLPRAARALIGVHTWEALWASDAIGLVQVHLYPGAAGGHDLMAALIDLAPRMARHGKPVLVGEAAIEAVPEGGDAGGVPASERLPRSFIGYRQALWTSLMSGYAVGGMFWWMSGHPAPEAELRYPALSAPVSRFVERVDPRGMGRVEVRSGARVRGVALSNAATAIGYVRDERCVYPDWPSAWVPPGSLTLGVRLKAGARASFFRPSDLTFVSESAVTASNGRVELALPAFREDLLFVAGAGAATRW